MSAWQADPFADLEAEAEQTARRQKRVAALEARVAYLETEVAHLHTIIAALAPLCANGDKMTVK